MELSVLESEKLQILNALFLFTIILKAFLMKKLFLFN